MRKTGTIGLISLCGAVMAAGVAFAGCSGFGGGQKTETTTSVTDTEKPTVETVKATTATTSTTPETTTTKEEKTTEAAGLSHESSEKKENTTGNKTYDNDYIFPDSDSRKLSRDDLKGFDVAMVRRARNEIFARHGFIFNDEGLDSYFQSKSWYNGTVPPEEHSNVKLNEYEAANRDLFLEVEDEMLHDLYGEVLGNGKYIIYSMAHLDTDGVKELVVSEYISTAGEGYGNNVDIYTYKDGRVSFVGHIVGSFMPLQYSSSRKSILYARGGGGSIEDIFYSVNGTKLIREEYLATTDLEPKYYHNYRSDDANTEIGIYDYEDEISLDEYKRGRDKLKEGMEDMVFEKL